MTELCPCGAPLHYASPLVRQLVQRQVDMLGARVDVEVSGLGKWRIPRHYIALHGLSSIDVPKLAERYHWPRVA